MNKDIKIVKIEPCENSNYISFQRVTYIQNGIEKTWDMIKTHDSVGVLLYHKEKESFLLVKQFRPALFINNGKNNDGFTYELCAGLMDKDLNEENTIREEVLEECGYNIELKNLKKIVSCFSNVGISGSKQDIFFSIIDESMRVSSGGGTQDESIELFFLKKLDAREFLFDESKPKGAGLLFTITWFLENENELLLKS